MVSFFVRRKRQRGFISDKWASLYQEKLTSDPSFNTFFKCKKIDSIHFLFFCVYTSENERKVNDFLQVSDVRGIKSIIQKTPFDFDSTDYPVIQVFEIKANDGIFLAMARETKDYTAFKVLYIIEIASSLTNQFDTSRTVYSL